MARFCTLFSGSDGNCTYVSGSDTAVLVDAGRSCKQLLQAMESRGINPQSIGAILITHEHTDHVKGLRVLLKKLRVPVYATHGVLDKLYWDKQIEADQEAYAVGGDPFLIGSMQVSSFDTPHDSIHSVGYRFTMADGRTVAIATDMGYMPDAVRKEISGCDLVLLESNYDPRMLSVCDYPYILKQRIVSNTGHLSNEACSGELVPLVEQGSTRLVLGHLSRRTNLPELALESARCALTCGGMRERLDYQLMVAPRDEPMEMVVL